MFAVHKVQMLQWLLDLLYYSSFSQVTNSLYFPLASTER